LKNLIITFIVVITIAPLSASIACQPWQAHTNTDLTNLKINAITITPQNIFNHDNPAENHGIHRLANVIHIKTRIDTIKWQLLFKKGDQLDLRLLKETERNIRANRYINNVIIKPVRICGDQVDILVTTTDNWTLTPGVSYKKSGGENTSGIQITEINLFGKGKSLTFSYDKGIDRNESLFRYTDPQFNGTHRVLSLEARNKSDGDQFDISFSLPFYQLNSKKSWGIEAQIQKQITPLYSNGNITSQISEDTDFINLFYGWSKGLAGNHVTRMRTGWYHKKTSYQGVNGSIPSINFHKLSYPWIEYEYFREQYDQRKNFRTMGRIEDISLGRHVKARLGLITEALGSSDEYVYLATSYSEGFRPSENQLGLLTFDADTYTGNGILNGSTIKINGEWFWFQNSDSNYYLSGKYNLIDNPLPGQQILLGGDTGLRGYPIRYQAGDKSLVITAEKQYFFKWYPYKLVQFGAVIFADAGAAWGQGNSKKVIADAGIGLRLVSTRSTGNSVMHIDLAFPINAPSTIDSYQLRITAEQFL